MDYLLLIISVAVLLLGFLGCLLPVLPGPPLSFAAVVIVHFTKFADFSTNEFVFLGLLALVVQILDYIVPVWGTKKFGGSRTGTWGAVIGLIAGLFFLPAIGPFGIFTILGGPFLGAYIGEKLEGKDSRKAMRAAFGSFIGFLAGTMMKLAVSAVIAVYFVREVWSKIF
ncbi:MAG: DUF456 domain-containing protein [Bacteroidales bacterium]|nr:DUF456 domain-containing protein [Bacteroidales bacterium]